MSQQYTQEELVELVLHSIAPRSKTKCKYCLKDNLEWVAWQDTAVGKTRWLLIEVAADGTFYHHKCKQAFDAYKKKKGWI